ncbi:MAG: type 2 isopentenyl-diphosphate Delta-isomerase [Clostridium sp.]|nr:type 2 isopentenyl-diphosphate Delta-isomerase [Clostridium sp.]
MSRQISRQERKLEHLWHAVRTDLTSADFSDVNLVHNCLPEASLNSVDLSTQLVGIRFKLPFFINAITGGVEDAENINRELALTAKECGLALAVGSQMAAVEDPLYAKTFQVVREIYPEGIIFANIGAYAEPEMAQKAVEMIGADALQVHLNIPQELMMPEGDTDFRGYRRKIEKIVRAVRVPVIVKEVGFGVAKEQAAIFKEIGVRAIDVGGKGGTNFMEIERRRGHIKTNMDLMDWGVPTSISILEAKAGAPGLDIVASGGINSGLLAVKSLALGANAVAVAGMAAKILLSEGREALVLRLKNCLKELRMVMVMLGCSSVEELHRAPLVITGETREWLQERGLRFDRDQ